MEYQPRYDRQNLIKGWNQEKLSKARVAILGSGQLASFTAASLSALGVGNLEIYDSGKNIVGPELSWLTWSEAYTDQTVKQMERKLLKMNPTSRVKGIPMILTGPTLSLLGAPSLIIDTTNQAWISKAASEYASKKKIPFFSAYASNNTGAITKVPLENSIESRQGPIISGILGGMLVEEVRKQLMPLYEGEAPVGKIHYSLSADRRFGSLDLNTSFVPNLRDKKVLMVGAGALGNFAGLGLSLSGLGSLDIMDYDTVDNTNLNRQVLFYDAVGKEKATALAERLRSINHLMKTQGLVAKLGEHSDSYFEKNRPDVILDCVDSFAARAFVNYFAVKHKIPVVSGGTNPTSGQVTVYVPGRTGCLNCKLGVDNALGQQLVAAPCRYAPDPSVIMTNQIVGSMIVGEAAKILDSILGDPVYRILKYDSQAPTRGGLIGVGEACDCVRPEMHVWIENVKKKYEARRVK